MVYYCPSCWTEINKDCETCPACNVDIKRYSANEGFIDKLIAALQHPEPTTPIRAAWILGQRRDKKAIQPLYSLASRSTDGYVKAAAIEALLAIGTTESVDLAAKSLKSSSALVRRLVKEYRFRNAGFN